jgi:hypothetical protein
MGRPFRQSPGGAAASCYCSIRAVEGCCCRQAAWALRQEGINVASHITAGNAAMVKLALRSVPGIGYATASYFLMLLGAPGVKPDRMIHRFLEDATGHPFTNAHAEQVLRRVAELLGVQPHEVDHAIWSFQRSRARRARDRAFQAGSSWACTGCGSSRTPATSHAG